MCFRRPQTVCTFRKGGGEACSCKCRTGKTKIGSLAIETESCCSGKITMGPVYRMTAMISNLLSFACFDNSDCSRVSISGIRRDLYTSGFDWAKRRVHSAFGVVVLLCNVVKARSQQTFVQCSASIAFKYSTLGEPVTSKSLHRRDRLSNKSSESTYSTDEALMKVSYASSIHSTYFKLWRG